MSNTTVTVSKVLHPTTNEVLAIEIVANDGQVYFVERPGIFFEGMRAGTYPRVQNGDGWYVNAERVEIASMP